MSGQEVELSKIPALVNPATGEIIEPTAANAAAMIGDLRRMRGALLDAVKVCEQIIVEESQRIGTKTLHLGSLTASISGGSEVVWDVEKLRGLLTDAGCPEGRIDELIVAHVEYKVNASVARQLAAANPHYAKAIEAAKGRVEKQLRVSVKEGSR